MCCDFKDEPLLHFMSLHMWLTMFSKACNVFGSLSFPSHEHNTCYLVISPVMGIIKQAFS